METMTKGCERAGENIPHNAQLNLPLLEVLSAAPSRPGEVYPQIAERLGVPSAVAERVQTLADGSRFKPFERSVRWARQDLVNSGHISRKIRGLWALTEKGRDHLANARAGVVITVFETERGEAVWAQAETASGVVGAGQIQSIITSPPYPIKVGREYGTYQSGQWLDWIVSLCRDWKRLLTPDGSLVLNLGECFVPGEPFVNLYQERLLLRLQDELSYNLAQRFVWHNPCKPPASNWVTVRKVRAVNRLEHVYWLAPNNAPKSRPCALKRPYSKSQLGELRRGGCRRPTRPSGHGSALVGFARDNGGAMPDDLLSIPHAGGNDGYLKTCKATGFPIHPARMPMPLAEFFIKLTTDENDLVADFLGGSGTTAASAEKLNRRWLLADKSLAYLSGASLRREFALA